MFGTSHIHPMLVHFPIALGLLGCLLEFIEFFFKKGKNSSHCGEYLLYFATASAILSLMSGFMFTAKLAGAAADLRGVHMVLAVLATLALAITSVMFLLARFYAEKADVFKRTGMAFYIISAALVSVTGFLGGTLVYNYMVGI